MDNSTAHLDLAEYLAETHFPDDPVEPLEIAALCDISSSFGHYEDAFDGLLELKANRFHIYLNRDRLVGPEKPRARFSAAHELGHYFIDDHRNALVAGASPHPSFTEFVNNSIIEVQADQFAAALLMPQRRFVSCAARLDVSLESIVRLAAMFGTSVMSTAIQFARSDVAQVSVMLWAETERRWCWSSHRVRELTQNRAYRQTSRVPAGSATRELLDSLGTKTPPKRGSVLSQWFPFVRPGSSSDKICREQAMQLGRYGILTLLEIY